MAFSEVARYFGIGRQTMHSYLTHAHSKGVAAARSNVMAGGEHSSRAGLAWADLFQQFNGDGFLSQDRLAGQA